MELDPDIFERTSRAGVLAQLPSPEDRAHYDYVLAKLYARTGAPDRSLHYLKKAMEEGYKDIKNVYKDDEFSTLRKDPRFAELMAAKTTGHPRLDGDNLLPGNELGNSWEIGRACETFPAKPGYSESSLLKTTG